MKLTRFAELVIQLVVAQEARRAGWPALHHDAIKLLREETAAAERLAASNARINETNRPKFPHETGDTCYCPTCCPDPRRSYPPSYRTHVVSCVPSAEYAALRELLRHVDMAEVALSGHEVTPLVQSVFNQLHAMRKSGVV